MGRSKIELLCPAGNMESAKAAIQMGADAIYLGMQKFNARANAGNFSDEQLKECIQYAHLLGVKVFLTSNTLVHEDETELALEQIEIAYKLGIDAVILQDLGLASLVHSRLPNLPMHASTQLTIYNREGALAMKAMGFSRVILARECGIEDIRDICSACGDDMEVEVFVHGAVCVSYSGQCLMSSKLANRSGNRGQCAQLCRMCYSINTDKNTPPYLLSPKDLCLLDRLEELGEAGVCCLKIEGRMKTPEYVGAVTEVYRRRLDGHRAQIDRQDLLQAFNRNGFTELYYDTRAAVNKPGLDQMSAAKPKNWGLPLGKIVGIRREYDRTANMKFLMVNVRLQTPVALGDGIEIMTGGTTDDPGTIVTEIVVAKGRKTTAQAGETVWLGRLPQDGRIQVGMELRKTGDAQSRKAILHTVQQESRKRPIAMEMMVDTTGQGTLVARAGHIEARGTEQILAQVDRPGPYTDRLRQQLTKTGNTPFVVEHLEIGGDAQGALIVSAVNGLRRKVLESLSQAILQDSQRDIRIVDCAMEPKVYPAEIVHEPINALCVETAKEALEASATGEYNQYILPISSVWNQDYRELDALGLAYRFRLPAISRGTVDRQLRSGQEALTHALKGENCQGLILGNIGQLWLAPLCKELGKTVTADYTFNICNIAAARACLDLGVDYLFPSVEVEEDQEFMESLCASLPGRIELRNHGFIPLMTSDFCPVGAYLGGKKTSRHTCSHPCTEGRYTIQDSRGRVFPLVCQRQDCRCVIMSNEAIENPALANGIPEGVRGIRQDKDMSEHLANSKHV